MKHCPTTGQSVTLKPASLRLYRGIMDCIYILHANVVHISLLFSTTRSKDFMQIAREAT